MITKSHKHKDLMTVLLVEGTAHANAWRQKCLEQLRNTNVHMPAAVNKQQSGRIKLDMLVGNPSHRAL